MVAVDLPVKRPIPVSMSILNRRFYPLDGWPFTSIRRSAIAAQSSALPKIYGELIDQFVTQPMNRQAVNAASVAFKVPDIPRN